MAAFSLWVEISNYIVTMGGGCYFWDVPPSFLKSLCFHYCSTKVLGRMERKINVSSLGNIFSLSSLIHTYIYVLHVHCSSFI